MNIPADLRYCASHEWIRLEGDIATVGISDHAQAELTDVVFVELPSIGRKVDAGDPTAVVESVKAASEVYSPVSGTVKEGNAALPDAPQTVNEDPQGAGWFFKIELSDAAELSGLMDEAAYAKYVAELSA